MFVAFPMRRLLAAATVREWRPCLIELNVLEVQYGAGVPKNVEHAGLSENLHQAGHGLILLDCSNALPFVKRLEISKNVSHRVPALTPIKGECYGEPGDIYRQLECGEYRRMHYATSVHQVVDLATKLFVMPLDTRLASARQQSVCRRT